MSRSSKRKDQPPAVAPIPPATAPSRGLLLPGLFFLLAAAGAALLAADWYYGLPEGAEAKFVGRGQCIECHQPQHEQFKGSYHDLAMDLATPETVLGDFSNQTLDHLGVTSKMFRQGDKFFVNTEGPDGKFADFEVKYVFGVAPLQQYMVEFDRTPDMQPNEVARVQVLRISWDTARKKWFHLDPPDVTERLAPSDELHWTGVAQRWNTMCADCHSTDLKRNYDPVKLAYRTTFSEIDVSCEACHGPGSLHVQLAQAKSPFWDRQRGYALAKVKGPENQVTQVQSCAPCHSRRRIVQDGFTAGCNYYDFYVNENLAPGVYHADGQIQDEVYEFGSFIQSKMYHKGIRCTDCHDPHTTKIKFEDNRLCTSCHAHPAGKYDTVSHHNHKVGSTGAKCVECHMPSTTYMAVDPRRDHSIRVPRPDLSVKIATPNACTGCHLSDVKDEGLKTQFAGKEYADWLRARERGDEAVSAELARLDQWSAEQVSKWFPDAKNRPEHYGEALASARNQELEAPEKLGKLLSQIDKPAIARATAALELARYLPVGSGSEQPLVRSLLKVQTDRDPQVRAAATMALQNANPDDLHSELPVLFGDSTRLVRTEAARVLTLSRSPPEAFRGDIRRPFEAALADYERSLLATNDRAGAHVMLGVLYENRAQEWDRERFDSSWFDKAQRAYLTGLRVEPSSMGPRTNLAGLLERIAGFSQEQLQQAAQAGNLDAVQKATAELAALQVRIDQLRQDELAFVERDAALLPDLAALQQRRGFSLFISGWRKEAAASLLNAYLLEPNTPEFAQSLAVFYRDTGYPEAALRITSAALKRRPDSRELQLLDQELRSPAPP